ncbi:MAG: UDP-N-acetylmuramoyl-L-alanine--D-glutamate ligase [Alphaproteobacteria bacterium]|nr:UDP-N-acetylmuramoyl-L-alanine--D-glutamate ligase [Alphaproteobacteria bacterium]
MIILPFAENKAYGVLGLGKTGLATARSLKASKAKVFCWDDNPMAREEALKSFIPSTSPTLWPWAELQAVVWSPGIPHKLPKPHAVAERAAKKNVPLICDIELLFQARPAATYIGITGTNGKSTTTALIGHMIAQAGFEVGVGGNMGTPALSLPSLGANNYYVIEVSSYQLELLQSRRWDVGVLLNITPDHLDRHGSMDGYIQVKATIANTSADQTLVVGTSTQPPATLAEEWKKQPHLRVRLLSTDHAVRDGYFIREGDLIDSTYADERMISRFNHFETLQGKHNLENALAAYAVGRAIALQPGQILSALENFPGLEHRQQRVRHIDNTTFINDSKATNADAAAKALGSYQNIYWILGGRPKEGGLSGLEELMPRVRHAYLIGEAAPAFAKWLEANKVPFTHCHKLERATINAAKQALSDGHDGATVLLSPACASWDQFKNFEERGNAFIAAVKQFDPLTLDTL